MDLRSTNTVWIPVVRLQPINLIHTIYELFSASQIFLLLMYCVFLSNAVCCVLSLFLATSLGRNYHH